MLRFRKIMAILVSSVYGLLSALVLLSAAILISGSSKAEHPTFICVFSFVVVVLFGLPWIFIFKWFKRISEDQKRISKNISSAAVVRNDNDSRTITHHLVYKDASGAITERDICVISVDSGKTFTAFCFLRGDCRTFRVDRIVELVDVATGEVIVKSNL